MTGQQLVAWRNGSWPMRDVVAEQTMRQHAHVCGPRKPLRQSLAGFSRHPRTSHRRDERSRKRRAIWRRLSRVKNQAISHGRRDSSTKSIAVMDAQDDRRGKHPSGSSPRPSAPQHNHASSRAYVLNEGGHSRGQRGGVENAGHRKLGTTTPDHRRSLRRNKSTRITFATAN